MKKYKHGDKIIDLDSYHRISSSTIGGCYKAFLKHKYRIDDDIVLDFSTWEDLREFIKLYEGD